MPDYPTYLSNRPDIDTDSEHLHIKSDGDVLSDVLGFAGLQGRVFCRATLRAPWSLAIPPDQLAHFHYIEKGISRLRLEGEEGERVLSAGEIAVLPHGTGHWLYDSAGSSSVPIREAVGNAPHGKGCALLKQGGQGEETRMLCGSFSFRSGRGSPILGLLPTVMTLFGASGDAARALESILRMIGSEAETQGPGSSILLSRMVEALFVLVLRSWLATDEARTFQSANWLMALKDDRIGRALGEMHSRPGHAWTLTELAAVAGMSRSPFAARFKAAAGTAPLAYLKRWRMQLAMRRLESGRGVKELAPELGYQSETSFSKAFKAVAGVAPGQWRKRITRSSSDRIQMAVSGLPESQSFRFD